MKNVIKLENYYSPEDLQNAIDQFVQYYNYHRYHESLNNMTPADVYYGRAEIILKVRQEIKEKTLKERRRNYILQNLECKYQ